MPKEAVSRKINYFKQNKKNIAMTLWISFCLINNRLNSFISSESNEERFKMKYFASGNPVDGILSHQIRLYFRKV